MPLDSGSKEKRGIALTRFQLMTRTTRRMFAVSNIAKRLGIVPTCLPGASMSYLNTTLNCSHWPCFSILFQNLSRYTASTFGVGP